MFDYFSMNCFQYYLLNHNKHDNHKTKKSQSKGKQPWRWITQEGDQESQVETLPTEYERQKRKHSEVEDTVENIDITVKENRKCKKLLTQNIQEKKGHNKKTKPKNNRYRRQ